jgi:hypothetical protein
MHVNNTEGLIEKFDRPKQRARVALRANYALSGGSEVKKNNKELVGRGVKGCGVKRASRACGCSELLATAE